MMKRLVEKLISTIKAEEYRLPEELKFGALVRIVFRRGMQACRQG